MTSDKRFDSKTSDDDTRNHPQCLDGSKFERLAMPNRWLEFEQVVRIFWIIFGLFHIVTRESLYAVETIPFRNRPKMADVALQPPPYLDAQVTFDFFVIRHARVDQELKIFVRVLGLRSTVPDPCNTFTFHNANVRKHPGRFEK